MKARVTLHLHLGYLYGAKGDLELCQVALEEAVQLSQTQLGNNSVASATAKDALGDCLSRRGESARAAGLYGEALAVFEQIEGPNSLHSTEARKKLQAAQKACKGGATASSILQNKPAPNSPPSETKPAEELTDGELVEAAKEFVSPKRTGQIGRAFALAAGGNIDDSVEEFADAEQDHEVDALAYRDYAMVMFVHGRIARAYFCSQTALALEPQIPLHYVLREVLRDFINSFNSDGLPNQQSVEAFTRLRVQYIRSKGI